MSKVKGKNEQETPVQEPMEETTASEATPQAENINIQPEAASKVVDITVDNIPLQNLRMKYTKYVPPEVVKRGFFGKKQNIKAPNSVIIRYINGRYEGEDEYIENPVGIPYNTREGTINYFTLHKVINKATGEQYEELRPLVIQEQIVTLPDSLYRKMYKWWAYKKSIAEALKPSLLEKLKIGVALGFFAISAIALFLIVISIAG